MFPWQNMKKGFIQLSILLEQNMVTEMIMKRNDFNQKKIKVDGVVKPILLMKMMNILNYI